MARFSRTKQLVVKHGVDVKLNMVFNAGMTDTELIAHLGGPTKVAVLLNLEKDGGVQRVQNWLTRGIPPKVKLEFPHIFLRDQQVEATQPA
jgi:hypothetical protein